MQPFRLGRWGSQILPLGSRQSCLVPRQSPKHSIRLQSVVAGHGEVEGEVSKRKRGRPRKEDSTTPLSRTRTIPSSIIAPLTATTSGFESQLPFSGAARSTATGPSGPSSEAFPPRPNPSPRLAQTSPPSAPPPDATAFSLEQLPSPPVSSASASAKLSALHSRLSLPSRLPLETLARTLVDKTADPDARFNNSSLAALGNDLLGYYMGEHLLCHYPRLPMAVLYAAQFAYVGPTALAAVAEDWGVEVAAEPGGEVNPGLLQFRRMLPGTPYATPGASQAREILATRPPPQSISNITPATDAKPSTTQEHALANFIRAVFAAMYLHTGAASTHAMFKAHVLSRHLDISSLFTFTQPTRDLSRLCAREGFDSPVARVISETGRLSRSPVFVVGVFSGRDKLGEAAGASLNEARFKAAVKALKGWYLYSPKTTGGELMVPSMMEGEQGKGRSWRPAHIDDGEVIV